ncbi:tetratricopeptide repeat protein [Kitasatospora purpeofusca]|uniref:tetratricopeptide repeat protein n=1 Tax=Kitasatospora purpeofusca TaxID=67352 RepID=UPI00225A0240|nr:tetratricopeptide repeat protein [Kitasatospora purpeofusca]MCX4689679.1 tetratricopeptide repeat protein [Kitasatospora purpeofusca]
MTRRQGTARAIGGTLLVLACAAGLLALGPSGPTGHPGSVPAPPPSASADRLTAARQAAGQRPGDATAWAEVGIAAVDRARSTLDGELLAEADRALARSFDLRPERNHPALVGSGILANARHEFATAREFGQQATAMAPDRAAGYAVLADAELQLGHLPAATAATQRLLDLAPTTAAYTRASYDLQTHGRTAEAVLALERALELAVTPGERAFSAHRLGDLDWEQGRPEQAEQYYRQALVVQPDDHFAAFGLARSAAALGRTDEALGRYADLVALVPQPQFLLEYAESLLAAGHEAEAAAQFTVLAAEVRLATGPLDLQLARYLADHGDPAEAVRLLTEEWQRRRSPLVAEELAWALHRAGRDGEALPHARFAAAPGGAGALGAYRNGVIEHALGLPGATELLREALRRNPYFSPLEAAHARELLGIGPAG